MAQSFTLPSAARQGTFTHDFTVQSGELAVRITATIAAADAVNPAKSLSLAWYTVIGGVPVLRGRANWNGNASPPSSGIVFIRIGNRPPPLPPVFQAGDILRGEIVIPSTITVGAVVELL